MRTQIGGYLRLWFMAVLVIGFLASWLFSSDRRQSSVRRARGEIKEVSSGSLALKDTQSGELQRFVLSEDTKMFANDQAIGVGDLKTTQVVDVQFEKKKGGQLLVKKIEVNTVFTG